MKYRNIGNSEDRISAIGLGCMGMSVAYGVPDHKESIATLHKALDLGVNFWDTADVYEGNEALISTVLSKHRKDVFIGTKFGWRGNAAKGYIDNSPAYIRQALESSLKNLRTDVIDLYYVHRLDPKIPVEDTIGAMAELVKEGKIRHLGMSEVSEQILRRANAVHPIAALQSEYSLLTKDVEADILPACKELGITLVAFSPTARGVLTNVTVQKDDLPENDRRNTLPRFNDQTYYQNNLQLAQALQQLAEEKEITTSQLSLAWLLAQGDQVVPIPGTKRRKYLEENARAAEVVLSDNDVEQVNRILLKYPDIGPRNNEEYLKLSTK